MLMTLGGPSTKDFIQIRRRISKWFAIRMCEGGGDNSLGWERKGREGADSTAVADSNWLVISH